MIWMITLGGPFDIWYGWLPWEDHLIYDMDDYLGRTIWYMIWMITLGGPFDIWYGWLPWEDHLIYDMDDYLGRTIWYMIWMITLGGPFDIWYGWLPWEDHLIYDMDDYLGRTIWYMIWMITLGGPFAAVVEDVALIRSQDTIQSLFLHDKKCEVISFNGHINKFHFNISSNLLHYHPHC